MRTLSMLVVLALLLITNIACTKKSDDKKGELTEKKEETMKVEKKVAEPGNGPSEEKMNIEPLDQEEKVKYYDGALEKYKKAINENPKDAKSLYSLGITYSMRGDNILGAKYLYEAGLLFLEKGNRYNALKAYQSLKRTNSKELEEALHEKLFPGTTQSEVSNK